MVSGSDYLLLVALSAIFGSSFTLTRIAVQEIPSPVVALLRLLLSFLVLMLFVALQKRNMKLPRTAYLYIVLSAFFGYALPFALISWGQKEIPAGPTAIMMAVMPLMTVLLAHAFTQDEKLNRYKLIGMLAGFAGVVILMGWRQLGSFSGQMPYFYAIFAGALCYAVNALITRHLVAHDRQTVLTSLYGVSALMLMPVLLFTPGWVASTSAGSWLAVLGLALGPTALGGLLILMLVERQGATFLSQINFLVPLFGILAGYVFLSEQLPHQGWWALLVIFAGLWLNRVGSRYSARTR